MSRDEREAQRLKDKLRHAPDEVDDMDIPRRTKPKAKKKKQPR